MIDALDFGTLFRFLEFPFLFVCIYFAFRTARALQGGVFGTGMYYLAWGFLIMAVGHIHMQIEAQFGIDIFTAVLGDDIGFIVWIGALLATWGLSGYGFYQIYRASKGY